MVIEVTKPDWADFLIRIRSNPLLRGSGDQ
jgi:hypothetical protein